MLDTVQGAIEGLQDRLQGYRAAQGGAHIDIEGGRRIQWAMRTLRDAGIDFSQDGRTLSVAPADFERARGALDPVQGYKAKGRGPGIRFALGFGFQAGIAIEDRLVWGMAILAMIAGAIILFAQGVLA